MVILYNNAMHISESEFLRNALQHPFQHLRASCLETGMAAIPLVIPLFCEEDHIMVFKGQKSLSPRTKVIAQKSIMSRSTMATTTDPRPPNFCSQYKNGLMASDKTNY